MKNQIKENRGITLIVLVITIIVVLIVMVAIGFIIINLKNNNRNPIGNLTVNNSTSEEKNNNSNSTKSSKNKETDKDFYVVFDSIDKKGAMDSNFKSKKIDKYSFIEKYDMKWISGNKLNYISVPVIPNRTRSFNSYSLSDIEMESDMLDMNYSIFDGNINKSKVDELFQKEKNKYSNESIGKWNKNTSVVEMNGVIGYAYSCNIINLNQIRIEYFFDVDNKISEKEYNLFANLSFDPNNYESIKPIIDELSRTLSFDIVSLIKQVL